MSFYWHASRPYIGIRIQVKNNVDPSLYWHLRRRLMSFQSSVEGRGVGQGGGGGGEGGVLRCDGRGTEWSLFAAVVQSLVLDARYVRVCVCFVCLYLCLCLCLCLSLSLSLIYILYILYIHYIYIYIYYIYNRHINKLQAASSI